MRYEELANEFLALIKQGEFKDAEEALDRLYTGFRSERSELAYLPLSFYYFVYWYTEAYPAACARHDVTTTLVRSANKDGRAHETVTWALHYFGDVLRFLGRYREAIDIFERVMRIEMQHWTLPIGPEPAWGASLAECYRQIDAPEQAARVTDLYMAEHDRLGPDAIRTRLGCPADEVTTRVRSQVVEKLRALGVL